MHDVKPHLFQATLANDIVFGLLSLSMIAAVNFYDQASMTGRKVGNIIADDVLTQEVDT